MRVEFGPSADGWNLEQYNFPPHFQGATRHSRENGNPYL